MLLLPSYNLGDRLISEEHISSCANGDNNANYRDFKLYKDKEILLRFSLSCPLSGDLD